MGITQKMKERWGVGVWGVIAILLAFSLAGMTVVRIKNPVLGLLLPAHSPGWLRVTVYILVVMPLYQISLLAWGTLFGQFNFFWSKLKRLGRLLSGRARTRPRITHERHPEGVGGASR